MKSKQRKALCVGINKFKFRPDANLQGCVNDAHAMKGIVTQVLGFEADAVRVLVDDEATKAAVMAELGALVAEAKAGELERLVFALSSHGSQIPDHEHDLGDEPDRADEVFLPHDFREKAGEWDRERVIVDDELRDLFSQVPEATTVDVFLDTCHSGTGLKDIDLLLGRRPRLVPAPSPIALRRVSRLQQRGLDFKLARAGAQNVVLWSGCRADQTSADAFLNGDYHGAFTFYFEQELRKTPNASRRDLLTRVRANLKEEDFTQVPQLETRLALRKVGLKA